MPKPIYKIPDDLIEGPIYRSLADLQGPANWGMKTLDLDRLRSINGGEGQIVGVVDTGIDSTHPELAQQLLDAEDFTGSPFGPIDRQGHGTHCSGTVGSRNPDIGVAYRAKLVHGKGLGDGGSGNGAGIARAMRWCFDKGARIISMSIGSSGLDPQIDAAGKELTQDGAWIVCAAGNSGAGTPDVDYPGRLPWAISVAAVDQSLKVASFSSSGRKINTAGPGSAIISCKPGGGYQSMSGTSMATPFVAGVLAIYRAGLMAKGLLLPRTDELQRILLGRSMDIGEPGVDLRTGPGCLWPLLLASELTPLPPVLAI